MFRSVGKVALAASCLGFLLAGCSFSVGTGSSLDKSTVEQNVSDTLTKSVGQKPESVTCPGPLQAKVGQSERCVLTAPGGARLGVTIAVTSTEGGNVKYKVDVDNKPVN